MNRERYIQAMDSLPIRQDFNKKTFQRLKKISEKPPKYMTPKKIALSAACLVLVAALSASYVYYGTRSTGVDNLLLSSSMTSMAAVQQAAGFTIPTIALPESSSAGMMSDMMPIFVYQGRVYINQFSWGEYDENGQLKNADQLLALRDQYLGKTKGTLDEWSTQSDYAEEFASTIGETEVYTIKGYDSRYRLMTDGGIFESYGGLTLYTGEDFFSLLNIKGHVESVQYQDYNSWNNSVPGTRKTASVEAFNAFLDALDAAKPVGEQTDLFSKYADYDSQKFVYIKTGNGLVTTLRLFKNGMVHYSGVGFFQMDEKAFTAFWDTLPVEQPQGAQTLPPDALVSSAPAYPGSGDQTSGSTAPSAPPASDVPLSPQKVAVVLEPSVYSVGTSSLTLKIRNEGTEQVAYGMEYSIEQQFEYQENGQAMVKWQAVPQTDGLMFIALAALIDPGQEQDFTVDLSLLEPQLTAGKYRVAKNVGGEMFYAEFELA